MANMILAIIIISNIPFVALCVIRIRVGKLGSFYPSMKEVAIEGTYLKLNFFQKIISCMFARLIYEKLKFQIKIMLVFC